MTVRKEKYNKTLYEIGQNLRKLRKHLNLTIEEFAELVNLSPRTISNYENGRNTLTIESLILIQEGTNQKLNFSLTELFDFIVTSAYQKNN